MKKSVVLIIILVGFLVSACMSAQTSSAYDEIHAVQVVRNDQSCPPSGWIGPVYKIEQQSIQFWVTKEGGAYTLWGRSDTFSATEMVQVILPLGAVIGYVYCDGGIYYTKLN